MAGARGDALEWALALAKAPSERLSLRHRPLPEGIDLLLQIAAGHAVEQVEATALRIGESPRAVLDAVRFYLREVLFHPDADAYRVLGLPRDADQAQIKAHHRLLQHWLHPDRQTSEWDAAFAARVNAAWHQLREAGRRQAYDAAHPPATEAMDALAFAPVGAGWVHDIAPEPLSNSERWRQRLPLLGMLLVCIALGLLALRDAQRDGDGVMAMQAPAASEELAGVGLDLRVADPPAVPRAEDRVAVSRPPARPVNASAPLSVPALVTAPNPAVASVPGPIPRDRDLPASAVAQASPAETPLPRSDTIRPRTAQLLPPSPPPPAAPGQIVGMRAPAPAVPGHAPVVAPRASLPDPQIVAVAPAAPRKAAPTPAQVQFAQQVGDRLLVFMRRSDRNVPPIWDSLTAQQGASQIRDTLLGAGDVRFAAPEWRVGDETATMRTGVRQANGVQGQLSADLVWREQRWLVRNLSLERDL